MAKRFRPWQIDQPFLLPPPFAELVPPRHPAHFVRELVRTRIDMGAILAAYDEARGFPPFHPAMMTALLLYGYAQGVFSSRRLAKACEERTDFMAVTAMQKPDFRTIAQFRKRHLTALGDLFVDVLRLCQKAGIVTLGHVALDGTKIWANASKHKAMSYRRMREALPRLRAEVAAWLERAGAEDAQEGAVHGDARGDEMPAWVANRLERIARIERAQLEREAKAAAERKDDDEPPASSPPPHTRDGRPEETAQRNFTDGDSRILRTRGGWVQGYNAQAAVDAAHQVVVASEVVAAQNDGPYLPLLLRMVRANTGRQALEVSADTAYCSAANFADLGRRGIRGYIATGRQRHGTASATGQRGIKEGTRAAAMRRRLQRGGFRSRYRLREQTVEPVFGQIKAAMGFRQFLLRGLASVRREWALVVTAHNLRKLIAATT